MESTADVKPRRRPLGWLEWSLIGGLNVILVLSIVKLASGIALQDKDRAAIAPHCEQAALQEVRQMLKPGLVVSQVRVIDVDRGEIDLAGGESTFQCDVDVSIQGESKPVRFCAVVAAAGQHAYMQECQ